MLFLVGVVAGILLMLLAQRRARAIRLRVRRRFGDDLIPASWQAWEGARQPARLDRRAWWREPG